MNRQDLIKKMKDSVGTKDPIEYFTDMVELMGMMFDQLDALKKEVEKAKLQSALAINWEPRIASDMLAKQVEILRQDKDTYFNEISALKKAFAEDQVTQFYEDFCLFWVNTLGWHPFLD